VWTCRYCGTRPAKAGAYINALVHDPKDVREYEHALEAFQAAGRPSQKG
jgi:hypothetical protein